MQRAEFLWAGLLVVSIGCGPQASIQPVSGRVLLDGEPLPAATVRFMPKPQKDPQAVKMMAKGTTNEQGEYSLEVFEGPRGAVVGANRVSITTAVEDPEIEGKLIAKEKVPPQYNVQSKLEFEVPKGGTEDADFDLTSKRRR